MSNKALFYLIGLFAVVIQIPVIAANHYVREGATGANNGSDWVNAFTDLPAALTRGDAYFIADGNYCPNGYLFDDPLDGDKYIKVLKATVASHGTDVGWDERYGDGQAMFTETIDIRTSYIVFDGITGGTPLEGSLFPEPAAYGFGIMPKQIHGIDHTLILAPHSADIDYIQISHCVLINLGYDWDNGVAGQVCIYIGPDYATDHYLISNNYMANASTLLVLYQSSNTIVENNYFMSNWSSPQNHGQLVAPGWNSDDVIFRNNVFYHPAVFVFGAHQSGDSGDNGRNGPSERWQVYNNIVIGNGSTNAGFANAESAVFNSIVDSDFHHNVFYNFDFNRGAVFIGRISDDLVGTGKSRVYNNIFYRVRDVDLSGEGYTPGMIIHGYNDYYDCTGRIHPGATDGVYTGIDPFVNSVAYDFRLTGPTLAGMTLPAPYHVDYLGVIRGLDGNRDRGVFEFTDQNPLLCITSPNNGETWVRGFSRNITWYASGVTEPVRIELLKAGVLDRVIAENQAIGNGSYAWSIPADQATGNDYSIKLTAGTYSDTSGEFTIAAPSAPVVATNTATSATQTSALLRGTVHPMGFQTTYHFEYGLTTAYGTTTPNATLAADADQTAVQAALSGLDASTAYHFRLVATNSVGTSEGNDLTFTTGSSSGGGGGGDSGAGNGGGGGCFMAATGVEGSGTSTVLAILMLLLLNAGGVIWAIGKNRI